MRVLEILYFCWIILCFFGWIISPQIAHNPDRFEEFLIMIGLIIAPLTIYYIFSLLITSKKNLMKILKILYICWVVFWGLGCIVGGFMAETSLATDKRMLVIGLMFLLSALYPLLPYFFYLIYDKITKSNNILFVITYCCLLLLIVVCYYLLLFVGFDRGNFMLYLIFTIMFTIIFAIIYKSKRTS